MFKSASIVIGKPQQGFDLGDTKTKDCVVTEIASGESKVRNIWIFSPCVPSKQEFCSVSFTQFIYFLREVCSLFNF